MKMPAVSPEPSSHPVATARNRVAVVIPHYNHSATLPAVVAEALAYCPTVIVVDDGSSPPEAAILDDLDPRARRLRHPENRGKGAAIRSGLQEARRLGATHIITIDADGQHFPADIPAFLEAVERDPEAIIIGWRDFTTTRVPGGSRFGRSFSNFWFRVQTGVRLGDTQSGFRAYPVAVLASLPCDERHYAFENEILVRAAWAGVRIREIPVRVHYPEGPAHISHFHRLRDNFRLSRLNTRLTIRSLLPWPHDQLGSRQAPPEKVSLLHPLRAIRLLLKENTTPPRLAGAVALGAGIGSLPLVGMQTMLILVCSSFLRLNKAAALGAANIGIPPLLPALCIETGHFLRHGRFLTEISLETLGYQAPARLWEWILGSLLVAPLTALLLGGITLGLALTIKNRLAENPGKA